MAEGHGEPVAAPDEAEQATILVVDDQPSIRKIVCVQLGPGYNLLQADGADAAQRLLKAHRVDLILCDVRMPGCDGYQFRERLLEDPELGHIPFIFLTSLSDTTDKVAAYKLDATDFITKPFKGVELVAKVRSVLSLRRKQRAYTEQERLEAIRKMVVTMNHEINNPLTAIVGLSELVLRRHKDLPEKVQDKIHEMHEAALRIAEVVKKLSAIEELTTKVYLSDTLMYDIDGAKAPDLLQ